MSRRPTVLLGVCGHESATGTDDLVRRLETFATVRTIVTAAAKRFTAAATDNALTDEAEWYGWQKVRSPSCGADRIRHQLLVPTL